MSLVVAVLVFTMAQSACHQERNESIRLMNAAVKLANEGRTEEAISRLSDAALVDPTNHRAPFNKGIILQKSKRFKEARKAFQAAVDGSPERAEYLYQLGMVLHEMGEFAAAIPVLKKSSQVRPNHGETWLRLGECQVATEDFDGAQDTLIKAIELKPLLSKSYLNLARLYSDFRQFPNAIQTYKTGIDVLKSAKDAGFKAAELDGVLLALHQDLGTVYRRLDRTEQAIEVLTEARALKKDEPATLFNLGMILKDIEGREDEAKTVLKRYVSLSGSRQSPWRKRAAEEAFDKLKARSGQGK
ncbi:MAG: tetratricopeptide repeat protein [Bradymonadia bacterium]